jgi:hypothetical protein
MGGAAPPNTMRGNDFAMFLGYVILRSSLVHRFIDGMRRQRCMRR